MRHVLFSVCRCLFLATLLVWIWLLWEQGDPNLLLLPSGIVYLGLLFHRIVSLSPPQERWQTFRATIRSLCHVFLLVMMFHLVSFTSSLISILADPPSHPSFLGQLIQGLGQVGNWIVAVLMVFLAICHLPGVEEALQAGYREDADESN